MALLEGLDHVAWERLQHAYGPAEDVPDLLRALVTPERAAKTIAEKAQANRRPIFAQVCWELWGNIHHQGSVWQASAKTVPFFVEILRDGPRRPELQSFVLRYLSHLAIGYPSDAFPQLFDPQMQFQSAEGFEDDGSEPDLDDERRVVAWQRDCYVAVERALAELVGFVEAADVETALEAMALVTWFPRQASQLTPALLRVSAAAAGLRAGTALVAAAHLDPASVADEALRRLASDEPLVALHAACANVLCGAVRELGRTVALLTAPLAELSSTETPLTDSVGDLVHRCVARLPSGYMTVAVDALADTA
jgi:hypothetical protein